ncbi:MAG: N-acetyl-gamma-glutamyl-phosphate reductase [Vicinamibacterales bacterium]
MAKIQLGIAGASGYGGQELLRLAVRHDDVEIAVAMSSAANNEIQELPALKNLWHGQIEPFSFEKLIAESEVVFLGLPDGISAELAPQLLENGRKVFDLSGAFRLRDKELRKQWYPKSPSLPETTTYGLPEWNREHLATANLVACAGCYPTAAILALNPLVKSEVLADKADIYIDAKSGVSGAGKKPSERTHFSEVHGSIAAYGIFSHRHAAEIEQELNRPVTFVPHLVPLDRGILETIYTRVSPGTTNNTIREALENAYQESPFVRLTGNTPPEIKHVVHTNFCDIGWILNDTRLVLVVCIDNLVKGAAGQALQSFNIAHDLEESKGLL